MEKKQPNKRIAAWRFLKVLLKKYQISTKLVYNRSNTTTIAIEIRKIMKEFKGKPEPERKEEKESKEGELSKQELWSILKKLTIKYDAVENKLQYKTATVADISNQILYIEEKFQRGNLKVTRVKRKLTKKQKKKKLGVRLGLIIEKKGDIWRQIELLYKSLNVKKSKQALKWPIGDISEYRKELKRLRIFEKLVVEESEEKGIFFEKVPEKIPKKKEFVKRKKLTRRVVLFNILKKVIKDKGRKTLISLNKKGTTVKFLEDQLKIERKVVVRWKKKKFTFSRKFEGKRKEVFGIDYTKEFTPMVSSASIGNILKDVERVLAPLNRNSFVIIKLKGEKELKRGDARIIGNKNSKGVLIANRRLAYIELKTWAQTFASTESGYNFDISKIILRVIPPIGGGCIRNTKVIKINGMKLIDPQSAHNNCFFAAIKKLTILKRLDRSVCNDIRKEFNIGNDEMIPLQEAFYIFDKYCKDGCKIRIINSINSSVYESPDYEKADKKNKIMIFLLKDHYKVVRSENYVTRKCLKCSKRMYNLDDHKCKTDKYDKCENCGDHHNPASECVYNKVTYYQEMIKGNGVRFLKDGYYREPLILDILHYDTEAHTKNVKKQHIPVIIGFTNIHKDIEWYNNNIAEYMDCENKSQLPPIEKRLIKGRDNFEYYAGKGCIDSFIDRIIEMAGKKIKADVDEINARDGKQKYKTKALEILYKDCRSAFYVNAFNGSGYDHYFVCGQMLNRGFKFQEFCMNNGGIIRARYKNIVFIDQMKYTEGSLRKNLDEIGASVKKGEFDYDLLDDWEKMSPKNQKDCIDYLESDVLGMRELYTSLNLKMMSRFRCNLSTFFSTSHATFNMWKHELIEAAPKEERGIVTIPSMRQDNVFRPSIYGGRCYKSKHTFVSKQKADFLAGEIKFEDIDDYIIDEDVVSLYPACMFKYRYPVGIPIEMKEEDIKIWMDYIEENGKCPYMGIFYIKYTANKHLQHAILGKRCKLGGLKWNLKDGEGFYNSVDIDNALECGYKIQITSVEIDAVENNENTIIGYYWKKSKRIFRSYIEKLFGYKKGELKGTSGYLLIKTFLNGLYGKTCQKPRPTQSKFISEHWEFWEFHEDNEIIDVELINGQLYLSGISRDPIIRERSISKPSHLGSFILAYSRRIMLEYMKASNKYFDISENPTKENKKKQIRDDFYYTDTDALQFHSSVRLPEQPKVLGGICNDIKGSKVLSAIYIAPKLYTLCYALETEIGCITEKEHEKEGIAIKCGKMEIVNGHKLYYHYKGKGIQQGFYEKDGTYNIQLDYKAYEKMLDGQRLNTYRGFQMNRIHMKKNSKQKELEYFSLYTKKREDTKRELNCHLWNGRLFNSNDSIPYA